MWTISCRYSVSVTSASSTVTIVLLVVLPRASKIYFSGGPSGVGSRNKQPELNKRKMN